MQRGYVKLWRKIEDSGLLQNPAALQVFCLLLIHATRNNRRTYVSGQIFELKPGGYATSLSAICDALNITSKQCRVALKFLEKLEIVASKTTNKGSVFSLINWERYQNSEDDEGQAEGKQRASRGQAEGKPLIKQELKKERIKELTSSASSDACGTQNPSPLEVLKGKKKTLTGKRAESFNRFWQAFAYKKDRAQAIDAWAAIPSLTDALVDTICLAAEREAQRRPELIAAGRTPIYAQGWISGRRWEDEDQTEAEMLGVTLL